ncbi:MAG: 50S ribosomal protein L18e [Candidatus Bathyarchaeia archaeon]|nr:50S ribosomal protein L18e [Candidatus Bathyarchaeota archaeon]
MDNIVLKKTIAFLKKKAKENNAFIWLSVAELLSKSRRRRICVNISKINRYSKDGDIIVVPGKVLGSGIINHKVIVGAFKFSESAKKKIEESGGECLSIINLVEKQPNGTGVKLIG